MDYSNQYYRINKISLNRKRQIIDHMVDDLHLMQMQMIEDVVSIKENQGFPEANEVINRVRSL
jgi:hypothetical protein